ncbi:ISNCY family transposase [Candidatus Gottesmanbacteria bacterium]|nr:ISNCY family transposase [Candidatus Gottesmanbacteria bacterium]
MKGYLTMSTKEAERITVMNNLIEKRIKQKHAAKQLDLSVRQVRRIMKRYKREGAAGLIHLGRGRPSNRVIPQKEKDRAIEIIKEHYSDFGPTFALEKLKEFHETTFGVDTLRKEMIAQDLWRAKTRKIKKIHPYRERRACLGELVQLDGSPHDWFEGRTPSCTLLAFIDDATNRIMDGCFVDYEGTWTLFKATKHYLKTHGKPLAFYVDRHSTFKINRQATIEEDLKDRQAQSQFVRAMDNLGVEVIFANSPEAKGRVENLFGTLQDRLIKEMRLAGINGKEEGIRFFREVYIPKHNSKFAVPPREKANLHRSLLPTDDLTRIFTIQSKRLVSKDLIVQYKNTKYQLLPETGYRYTLKQTQITVEENENGRVVFRCKDKAIASSVVIQAVHKQKTPQVVSSKDFKEDRIRIPSWDHPWRQARRLAIILAKQHHEAENGGTVLTVNSMEENNPAIITPV